MKKLITITTMACVLSTLATDTNAQYLGPRIDNPMPSGDRWLVNVSPGGYSTHQGDGFYSIDFDDDRRSDGFGGDLGVSQVALRTGVPGYVTQAHNTSCPNTFGTDDISYGCKTTIYLGGGYDLVSGHAHEGSVQLQQGQYVTRDQLESLLGNSGFSSNPHNHRQPRHNSNSSATNRMLEGVKVGGVRMVDYNSAVANNWIERDDMYYPGFTPNPDLTYLPSDENPLSCVTYNMTTRLGVVEPEACLTTSGRLGAGMATLRNDVDPLNPGYDFYEGDSPATWLLVYARRSLRYRVVGYRETDAGTFETRPEWSWWGPWVQVDWNPAWSFISYGVPVRYTHVMPNITIHNALQTGQPGQIWTRWIFRVFIRLDSNGNLLEDEPWPEEPEFIFSYRVKRRPTTTLSLAAANCIPEICGNGTDDDCDGQMDSVDTDCQTPPLPTSIPGPSQSTAGSDSLAEGEWDYFTVAVDSTEIEWLTVTISDLSADIDLFVRHNALPTRTEANCVSVLGGTATDRCEINDPTPGTWHIGVYGYEAGRYSINIETTRRGYCTSGAWQCSDPFPSECPPWGQRSRTCTLVNTGCVHPELVGQPQQLEPCPPPPCQPAFVYRIGGAPRARAQEVEVADLGCPSILEPWDYTTPLPAPRVGMGCTVAGGPPADEAGCIICTGGVEPGAGTVTDVFIGCPNVQGEIPVWNQSPYHLPIAMSYHHAWTWQNRVCVMPSDRTLAYCASWDAATKDLSEVFRLAQGFGYEGGREDKGLAVFGDNICVAGGINLAATSPYALADTQCTSLFWDWNQVNMRPWTRLSPSLPLARYAGNLTSVNDALLYTGGVGNASANDMTGRTFLLSLDPSQTDSPWVEGPTFAPGVYNHTVFVHDNRVYLVGGYGPNGFVPNVHSAVFLGPTSISPWEAVAPLHSGVASTSVIVIERVASSDNQTSVATIDQSPDAGLTTETAIDAGTMVVASVTDPSMGYVLIPAGAFLLGSPESEAGRWGDEGPQIQVAITRDFWMKATEVTCNEWRSLMGSLPDVRVDPACTSQPANYVSFDQAISYVNALSVQEGLTQCFTGTPGNWNFAGLDCPGYRLPTEAEWEYAAKAGTAGPYYAEPIGSIAWYNGNSGSVFQPVGQKAPNAWGLYDIIGNAHERTCSQYIEAGYSGTRPIPAELCSTAMGMKSTRGGGFNWDARTSRASTRGGQLSDRPGGASHGLRPVRTVR